MQLDKQRILLTGASGFLGRHVRECLWSHGVGEGLVMARRREHPLEGVAGVTACDLRDQAAVRKLFDWARPDLVIHLAAAVGGIGANQKHPGAFFRDNMLMGLNLIEEARLHGVQKFVCIGTCCSYPKFTPVPFKESDLHKGQPEETNAGYGLAKRALLTMLQAYRDQYGLNGIYLIPSNLYGPGDNFDLETSHVIPAMIRVFSEAKRWGTTSVTLWGTGSATREFLFVRDAAEAIVLAAERYDGGDPINLGTGQEIAISYLAEKVADLVDYRGDICWDHVRPDGQPRRCLDTSRAAKAFGWEAGTKLDDGLRETIAWYEKQTRERHGAEFFRERHA